ncbi:MAG: hypothetical protein KDI45_12605 [Candidatus Accumulibacter sp.]|nr:hypothetical protein [Accumulibacter sp.]MCB1940544.1 hypothetical protein [Accumulibacter sp.]
MRFASESCRVLSGARSAVGMAVLVEVVMMAAAALMLVWNRVDVGELPETATLHAGVVATSGQLLARLTF